MATDAWLQNCLNRRKIGNKIRVTAENGSKHFLGGSEIIQRFFFGLCPVCYKIGEHSACAGCMMVSYCSRDCQKKDWKNHKLVCKVLSLYTLQTSFATDTIYLFISIKWLFVCLSAIFSNTITYFCVKITQVFYHQGKTIIFSTISDNIA